MFRVTTSTTPGKDLRAVTRAWPLEAVVHAAFEGHGLREKVRFQLGLRRIESYVHAAATQVARIDVQMTEYMDSVKAEHTQTMPEYPSGQLFADAHFYFVCWDSVAKELTCLRSN